MTEPTESGGEAVPSTVQIDPFVALQEVQAKAAADEHYWRNRCLVLAQKLQDATTQFEALSKQVAAMQAATEAEVED
jgi:hypothetical protein